MKCPKCDRLTAWNKDGSVNEEGMALHFLEKLIDAEREIKRLRGSGMCDCRSSGSRNESDAEKGLSPI